LGIEPGSHAARVSCYLTATPRQSSVAWPARRRDGAHATVGAHGVPRDVQQAYAKGTRSPDGRPGPNYWQNQAEHRIRISLNPPSRPVQGEQDIVYSNSPDPLSMLVFRLFMDAHRAEEMRERTVDARFMTDRIAGEDCSIDGKAIAWNDPANLLAEYNPPGSTIHALPLGTPIPPKSSVRIGMRRHYDLVADKGWKEGAIDETTYFLAYFFPRINNSSDDNAWDVTPFTLGREFNNDCADFQVDVLGQSPAERLFQSTLEGRSAAARRAGHSSFVLPIRYGWNL
jgi:hypothetical protein